MASRITITRGCLYEIAFIYHALFDIFLTDKWESLAFFCNESSKRAFGIVNRIVYIRPQASVCLHRVCYFLPIEREIALVGAGWSNDLASSVKIILANKVRTRYNVDTFCILQHLSIRRHLYVVSYTDTHGWQNACYESENNFLQELSCFDQFQRDCQDIINFLHVNTSWHT